MGISYRETEVLSWEFSARLGGMGPWGRCIAQILKVVLPILFLTRLALNPAANAFPFVAIAGLGCGVVAAALVTNLIDLLRLYFGSPGLGAELLYETLRRNYT